MDRGFVKGALLGVGLLGASCAVVAPRPRSYERGRTWAYLRRFRYAHRGLHDLRLGIPENSIPAFERAASLGFGSELDVHLTSDKRLVVVHDSDLMRLTGEKAIVEELAFPELARLRLSGTEERIPLFSEALDVYGQLDMKIPLIVEVKAKGDNYAQLAAAVVEELDRHALIFCVESFDPRVVQWLRLNRGDVFRGQLAQNFLSEADGTGKGLLADCAATLLAANVLTRPDFVAYRWSDALMPPALLATKVMGAAYVGWTLHSMAELLACERRGGIGIFEGFVPDSMPPSYPKD